MVWFLTFIPKMVFQPHYFSVEYKNDIQLRFYGKICGNIYTYTYLQMWVRHRYRRASQAVQSTDTGGTRGDCTWSQMSPLVQIQTAITTITSVIHTHAKLHPIQREEKWSKHWLQAIPIYNIFTKIVLWLPFLKINRSWNVMRPGCWKSACF